MASEDGGPSGPGAQGESRQRAALSRVLVAGAVAGRRVLSLAVPPVRRRLGAADAPLRRASALAAPAARRAADAWARFVQRALASPSGPWGTAFVAVVCFAVTLVLWWPLSLPATWINALVKWILPRSCDALLGIPVVETVCFESLGLMTWAGSLLTLGVVYFYRRQLSRLVTSALHRLRPDYRFLAVPVLTTVLFIAIWAGNSFHWWTRQGLLLDGVFPVIVGLMAHVLFHHGPALQQRLAGFMERRDRVSFKLRVGLTFVGLYPVPFLLAGFMGPPAVDQAVVLVGTAVGFLLLAPRQDAPHGGI